MKSESGYVLEQAGAKHYMHEGEPGYFQNFKEIPNPMLLSLFDLFGYIKKLMRRF